MYTAERQRAQPYLDKVAGPLLESYLQSSIVTQVRMCRLKSVVERASR
jgi:hypothetical protein